MIAVQQGPGGDEPCSRCQVRLEARLDGRRNRRSEFRTAIAARARRNGRPVWAGTGVTEEAADFVGGFGREDVFELAGLLFNFGFAVHRKAVGEQALGQAMTANDAAGALAAAGRKFDD